LVKYTFGHYQEPILRLSLTSPEDCNEAEGKALAEVVTVLIVEDDQLIQAMVEEALSDGVFKSVVTGSGEEAVALLKTNESVCRAIVTDINLLGRIDGWEVARCAREIEPALPVIYMTGTQGEDWPSKGLPNSVLLTKPFAPAQLVTAISNLLNAASPPSAPVE
jgi:DNA-binding response OmpR family regulator